MFIRDITALNDLLKQRRQQLTQSRELDFLGRTHEVCGFRLRIMTPLDFAVLSHKGSPLLYGQNPSLDDLSLFLWVLAPGGLMAPSKSRLGRFYHAWAFGRACRRLDPEATAIACLKYVKELFEDVPANPSNGDESPFSFVASWCYTILSSMSGFTEKDVLTMPLPKLFQYARAIKQAANPKAPEANRKIDDAVDRILRGLNDGLYTMEQLQAGTVDIEKI